MSPVSPDERFDEEPTVYRDDVAEQEEDAGPDEEITKFVVPVGKVKRAKQMITALAAGAPAEVGPLLLNLPVRQRSNMVGSYILAMAGDKVIYRIKLKDGQVIRVH